MSSTDIRQRYSSLSIALHWVMLLLLVAVYASKELRGFYPRGSEMRDVLKLWHYMLGLSVLVLVAVRVVARLSAAAPPITPPPSAWQASFARIMHLMLYAFMIGMPISGWVIVSAMGKDIPFFGLSLPPLVGKAQPTVELVEPWHKLVATFGYYLIGLHALAALFHHYVMRDDVLRRMLPRGQA